MFFKKKEKPEYEMFMQDAILRSLMIDESAYVLQEAKIYKTKAELCIAIVNEKEDGFHNVEKKSITIPRSEDVNLQPFEFEGHTIFWDYKDMTFRYRPAIDKSKRVEINKWFHIVDDKAVWVSKKYAEINLTPFCLSYAYDDGKGNYLWSKEDNSSYVVFTELFRIVIDYDNNYEKREKALIDIANEMSVYDYTYYCDEFEANYLINYEEMKDAWFIFKQFDYEKLYNREIIEIED